MCCGRNCGGWIYICGGMGCKGEEKAFFAKPESWGDRLLTRAVLSVGPSLADENGWPERHYGRWLEALRVFGCQGTGGQRFEHLAAKRDWHVAALKIPQRSEPTRRGRSGKAFGLSGLGVQKILGRSVTGVSHRNTYRLSAPHYVGRKAKRRRFLRNQTGSGARGEATFTERSQFFGFCRLGTGMALLQKRTQS